MVGRQMPHPPKPWRQLSTLERSRWQGARALWRSKHQKKEHQKTGRWIIGIREALGKTQGQFADLLGVDKQTVVRWELGYGYRPSESCRTGKNGKKKISNMQRLRNLEATIKTLQEEKLEFGGK